MNQGTLTETCDSRENLLVRLLRKDNSDYNKSEIRYNSDYNKSEIRSSGLGLHSRSLPEHIYVCKKCYKTTSIRQKVAKEDLLRIYCCPKCQSEISSLITQSESKLNELKESDTTKKAIESVIQNKSKQSVEELTLIVENYKSETEGYLSSLLKIEEKIGQAFIITKQEVIETNTQVVLNQRNKRKNKNDYQEDFDEMHEIFKNIFQERKMQERTITNDIQRRNW